MCRWLLSLPVLACLLAAAPPVPGPKGAPKAVPKRGYFGLQLRRDAAGQVVVQLVLAGAPAEQAGVKPGDVLVSVDGVRPADLPTAVRVIGALRPGQKARVVVKRDGREKELEVKVGAL
jgi:S1-C subfamily serine protease